MLWQGLPVVEVRRWDEVTPAFLRERAAAMRRMSFDLRKAFAPYWLGLLRGEGTR